MKRMNRQRKERNNTRQKKGKLVDSDGKVCVHHRWEFSWVYQNTIKAYMGTEVLLRRSDNQAADDANRTLRGFPSVKLFEMVPLSSMSSSSLSIPPRSSSPCDSKA